MDLPTKFNHIFNHFFVSSTMGYISGGVLYIASKDLINKFNNKSNRKYMPLNIYTIHNKGAFYGLVLGVTRWYLQKPVLDYFLK